MIHRISWCYILAFLGCDSPLPHHPLPEEAFPIPIGSQFDPSLASTIRGRVTWEDDIPVIPSFEVWSIQLSLDGTREKRLEPNPNAPAIDAKTRGVVNAVVFLREVDLVKSKPWNHLPVKVAMRDRQFHILQGDTDSRIGFVRRGDPIEMVSREAIFHSLHAAGASFFTLPFPDPDDPDSRHLNARGIVELTSAAGYFAMRAYLFVDDHPYYTKTDGEGRFVLEQVPPGEYEVIVWMPNWKEESHERDPETAIISRLFFQPPAKQIQSILIGPKETRELNFQFSARSFQRKP